MTDKQPNEIKSRYKQKVFFYYFKISQSLDKMFQYKHDFIFKKEGQIQKTVSLMIVHSHEQFNENKLNDR